MSVADISEFNKDVREKIARNIEDRSSKDLFELLEVEDFIGVFSAENIFNNYMLEYLERDIVDVFCNKIPAGDHNAMISVQAYLGVLRHFGGLLKKFAVKAKKEQERRRSEFTKG